MIIISSAKMGNGTFQAKFIPLSKIEDVKKIFVLRKEKGPKIDKVEYIVLPKVCSLKIVNLILTPILLAFYAKKHKADFILSYHFVPHAIIAHIAFFLTGKKFVFAQTGGDIQEKFKNTFWKLIVKHVFNKAELILVPGKQARDFWVANLKVDDKIHILHSTINIDRFKPDKQIKKDIDVLYVGILDDRKQVDKIIKAFFNVCKSNNKLKLGIVGKGPLFENLKNLVKESSFNKNVVFFGYQQDVLPFLQRSKIFIMASKMEGLPVALMEAMACELLVIAPAVDNIPTVLKSGETGFLMPNTEQITINNTLKTALMKYGESSNIMQNARMIIVNKYSYNYAISKWKVLFKKI